MDDDDPFAPTFTTNVRAADQEQPAAAQQEPARRRDQAMSALWQLGSVVGTNLAAASAVAHHKLEDAKATLAAHAGHHGSGHGGYSRPDQVPKLPVNPEAERPVLDVKFDGLLAGEKVYRVVPKCFLLLNNPFCESAGRLLVSNYRIKFQVPKGSLRDELFWIAERQFLDIPMGLVEDLKLENTQSEAGAQEWRLIIVTKDFRNITILVPEPSDLAYIEELVFALSMPGPAHTKVLFAFHHAAASGLSLKDGWDIHDAAADFARMGVDTASGVAPSCPWVVSDANNDYQLCDTYPPCIVMPKDISGTGLRAVAGFRKRGRLPTLSWCGGADLGYAGVWRCSQPMEGLMGNVCADDELLVSSIRHGAVNGKERDLLVVDLRPWKAAYANKVGGGGFEAYGGCRLIFGGIDNVHGVRDAWKKMAHAVANVGTSEVGSWFKDVANSGWYDIIGALMYSARQVVSELDTHRCSALIHCSDGWDRTAQVSSLIMLCMDPYYRSTLGFVRLIQKEFCSFGHRFRTRLAVGEKSTSETSPIFLQWLECIYQLTVQFPTAFEFSEAILLHIAREVLTNRYGTFLVDSDKERREHVVPYTLSFWPTIFSPGTEQPLPEFANAQFQGTSGTLLPSPTQVNFSVWESFWYRFHPP